MLRTCAAAAVFADVRDMVVLVEGAGTSRRGSEAADQQRGDESEFLEGHGSSPLFPGGVMHLHG